jgi:hypothetical protein
MFTRRALVVALSLVVAHVIAAPASAQSADVRRPFRGLFGAPSSSESPHSLTLTASTFAAYDDNVLEGLADRQVDSRWLQQSGTYYGANAGLNYNFTLDGERYDLGGQAGAQVNYFHHEGGGDVLPSYQGSVTFGARITRSMTFSARQTIGYTSLYVAGLGPPVDDELGGEIAIPDDPAFALFEQRALLGATRLSVSQTLGRYASVGGSYHFRMRQAIDTRSENSPLRDYTSHTGSVGIQYGRPMTRHSTLRLGYRLRVSDRARLDGEPDVMHHIDAGVDYSRALSISRRTFLSFGSGSAIVVSDELPAEDTDRRVSARLTGNVVLTHEIGRTWTADLRYSRGFRTREGFDALYFTDALTASIGGLVSRRLSLGANAVWAQSSREQEASRKHGNRYASAYATYGITSYLAAYARYVYIWYRSDEGITLDDRFPQQMDRQGVRVGLTTSLSLIR